VFLYIRSLLGDENIAEEVAQETFFKALKAIDGFDGSKDIRAWLFTIAKNTYFSYYKRNKRNIGYDSLDDMPDTGVTITEHLSNEEEAFIIYQFLHRW